MANYNRTILIGNLTRDPEYKQLTSGQPVSRLGLASNRQYKNKQTGAMVQEVCFIDVDVFGPQAESCRQYLQKGSPVLVEGRLKFDTWESPDGQKRSKHFIVADRVVFLSSAQVDAEGTQAESSSETNNQQDQFDQILGQVKAAQKISSAKKEKKQTNNPASAEQNSGELAFKDEPPFQDDLPF